MRRTGRRLSAVLFALCLTTSGCASTHTWASHGVRADLPPGCSGPVQPPGLLEAEPPRYTPEALDALMEGHAAAHCTITRAGVAENCRLGYAPPGLEQAFLDAVATYRFQPAVACGEPADFRTTVRYRFRLPPDAQQRDAPASSVRPLPFGEGMTRPKQVSGQKPQYTPEAVAARAQGLMIVRCVVTADGRLERCRILQSVPLMDEPVLEALATHRYQPVTYQGQPIAADYTFNIRLTLPR